MKKKVAISLVIAFVLGFLGGYQANQDSSKITLQPILKNTSSMVEKTADSLQVQKTDVQCFVEALIVSIYPNTALRLNNCKTAHVDVMENGLKKMVAKDNGKDVLKALEDYYRSNVELGDFDFFISMLIYQLSLENGTIAGGSKNWILFPYNLLLPYASIYPEAYYYSALGNLRRRREPSKDDCETALDLYSEYRRLGGNIEIKFEDICKD
ncbi:hypothetical protein Fisuc_0821 [Fibrobacter succinogenes subsp. succinogenes S85]|uniref:Lipoprotein n=1 Tax=Fibrobacter succinogenes (strain ATCC 19169 / S85) TaxID=59374 RepID=A0ABN3YSJ3_FIBSS|nr:hypothetical protein [Fibrobacter succinogenes]ACX74431.1 hypothetical protein Fisuc_0821 [Fibrobacter succinogenes subsp. succinogenes S85]